MTIAGTLPNLFVIGAPKCGTTSLHHYLDQHPGISMTSQKEPWVFARDDFRERVAGYVELLDGNAPVRGESSAVYSIYPHFPGVPERIHAVVPQARFIYLVGDPIERAVSHHAQRLTDGTERRELHEALADYDSPDNVYIAASRYGRQLERYLALFDDSAILVESQDDLRTDTAATLGRVFAFLGVDREFRSPAFESRLNRREEHRVATPLGARIRGTRVFEGLRQAPLPAGARVKLRRLVSRGVGRPRLDAALQSALAAELAPEVAWLRQFTGREFPGWSV